MMDETPELDLCPFCSKPFILHSPKAGVTAFQHYSEGCPLHEREMQFVNLPIETMAAMLNQRPVEHMLTRCVQSEGERADAAQARAASYRAHLDGLFAALGIPWLQGDPPTAAVIELVEGARKAAEHNGVMAQRAKSEYLEMERLLIAAEAENEKFGDALERISNWAKAYPLDVFPEPDFQKVRELLEAGGITIDSVSASNMRHVVEGVGRIADEALKGGEE